MSALAVLFDDALGAAPLKSVGAVKAWVIIQCILCPPDTNLQPVLWGVCSPSTGISRGRGTSVGTAAVWVRALVARADEYGRDWGSREHIPVEHTAGRSQVCHCSAALGPAAAWQHRNSHWRLEGKGLKSFPFTSRKYERNTWKGCQECCWEEGQLFVFCPPPEYNLFKYLHVLLLKDFFFFPILLWLLSYEWWSWRDL